MLSLLKVFGRGVLVTIMLPFIVLIWVLYALFCCGSFIYMFFKSVIDFFSGKDFSSEMPEDIESRRIILENEKQNEQAKEMLNVMYQNVMNQQHPVYNEPTNENTGADDDILEDEENYEPSSDIEGASADDYKETSLEEYGESDDDIRDN